jgi:hypothetical protein
MKQGIRSVIRLSVGLFTLVLTGIGSAAYASVPPPDPVTDGFPQLSSGTGPVISSAGASFTQEIAWMATGAAVVLFVTAVAMSIAVLSKRHHQQTRQLQMP